MRRHTVLNNTLSLIVCGLLVGAVVAAAAFPPLALSGMGAKEGAEAFGATAYDRERRLPGGHHPRRPGAARW
ncbi:hypothetical protein [Micromonospora sp. NPDC050276]|uniref:hypothetical protein n=1 Tax=Micromonospora sp. NPDC050276 TaxID=3364278 RepID=UPI00378AB942